MIRKIIIPTWQGHFLNAFSLVKSYENNVLDREKITLCFVTSNEEETRSLEKIIGSKYEIHDILSLIKKTNLNYTGDLYKETAVISNKHPYQAIKKLFALKTVEYDQALLMDCEANFIKKIKIGDLFDEYFSNPFVFYSKITNSLRNINDSSIRVIDPDNKVLQEEKNYWCFEYHGWFVEKNIFNSFFSHIEEVWKKDVLSVTKSPPTEFFEIISYYWFIKKFTDKNYKFISIEDSVTSIMKKYELFLNRFSNRHCGIIEFMMRALDEEIYEDLKTFIIKNNLKITRIENNFNLEIVKKIIRETDISIIACSEDYTKHSNILEFVK